MERVAEQNTRKKKTDGRDDESVWHERAKGRGGLDGKHTPDETGE